MTYRPCEKRRVIAEIQTPTNGLIWAESTCRYEGSSCPRKDLASGECPELCEQRHAEINLIQKLRGIDLGPEPCVTVRGHYYVCEACAKALRKRGFKRIIVEIDDE